MDVIVRHTQPGDVDRKTVYNFSTIAFANPGPA